MNHQSQQPMGQQTQYGQSTQGSYYGDHKDTMLQQQMHQPQPQSATAYEHASKLPSKFQFGLFDCFSPLGTCRPAQAMSVAVSDVIRLSFMLVPLRSLWKNPRSRTRRPVSSHETGSKSARSLQKDWKAASLPAASLETMPRLPGLL